MVGRTALPWERTYFPRGSTGRVNTTELMQRIEPSAVLIAQAGQHRAAHLTGSQSTQAGKLAWRERQGARGQPPGLFHVAQHPAHDHLGMLGAGGREEHRAQARSEEHTSELQSLM